jgi:integrase
VKEIVIAPSAALVTEELHEESRLFLGRNLWARKTQIAYEGAWVRYVASCKALGRDPRAVSTVADYLRHLAELPCAQGGARRPPNPRRRPSLAYVRNARAAILAGLELGSTPINRADPSLRNMMKAIARSLGASHPNRRDALDDRALERVVSRIGTRLIDARDRALLLLGFLGCRRRSEILALDVEDVTFAERGLDVFVRRSKTDQEAKGVTFGVPYQARASMCAGAALRTWYDVSGIEDGPIFRSVMRWGQLGVKRLGGDDFNRIVRARCAAAGLDVTHIGAHSLRVGFITSADARGATAAQIMQVSGHRSVQMIAEYTRPNSLHRNNPGQGMFG